MFLSLCLMLLFISATVRSTPALQGSEYDNLEAVIETSRGQIVMEFFYNDAPRHVEYFVKQARAGAYNGTTFHSAVDYALIQGGDPLTKNPRAKAQYGTGGLNAGLPDEVNKNKHLTGAVSSVLQLDRANTSEAKPGTSGQQFFIILNAGTAQKNLDAQLTVFGRVVEGLDAVAAISVLPKSGGLISERVEITKVTVREKTPSVEQMKAMTISIETSLGNMKLEMMPEAAPNNARAFVRFARSGMYDGAAFYRVSQQYYIEAGSLDTWPPDSPNRKRFFALWPMPFEKNEIKQVRGTLSVRQAPEGQTSWYFFIISKDNPALDGRHAAIAKVTEGLDVLDKIAEAEVEGDKPKQRIEIKKITVQ